MNQVNFPLQDDFHQPFYRFAVQESSFSRCLRNGPALLACRCCVEF
jgi:hypothetical protein